MPAVGTSVARKDGIGKATGASRYADDFVFPGMLHGRTIRSTIARGRVTNIRFDFDTTGFTIVDYRDIPAAGRNVVALIEDDQPFLVETDVRHVAEPIVLLAHENRETLLAANVVIEYEAEVPEYDPEHSRVTLKALSIDKGNLDAGFATADLIIEGTYRTGHQEHVYIEPNGVIADRKTAASRCTAPSSAPSMSTRRSRAYSARAHIFASCRRKPAAASAARRNIRRCWPDTPHCSRSSRAGP